MLDRTGERFTLCPRECRGTCHEAEVARDDTSPTAPCPHGYRRLPSARLADALIARGMDRARGPSSTALAVVLARAGVGSVADPLWGTHDERVERTDGLWE